MKRLYNQSILSSTGFASTTTSSIVNMDQAKGYCCIANISNDTPAGKNFLSGESEINTLTFPALAAMAGVSEVNTLTFEAQASMDDGEYVVVTDTNGDLWAIAADLTGSSAAPSGAVWAAIPAGQKAQVDLSSATDAASVAAAFEVAFDALTGFSAVCATDDSAADGTMTFTQVAVGPVADAVSYLEDDSGAGGVAVVETTAGVADTDGEYVVITDTNGDLWAVAVDLTGSSAEPTGAIWATVPVAQRAQVDVSGTTDAASVAAAFEVAFDGITGFSAVCATDDSAADGTMIFTQVGRGPVANAQSLLEDDASAGSVSVAETNAGVASAVDISADTITIASHGLATGVKIQLTTTGTLPAGLALITDYFVIVVDANTIQLASSLANAQAGTDIDITDQGADGSTNTLTGVALAGASATLYASLDGSIYAVVPSSAQNITASCQLIWNEVDPMYKYLKLVIVLTAGQLSGSAQLLINGDGE